MLGLTLLDVCADHAESMKRAANFRFMSAQAFTSDDETIMRLTLAVRAYERAEVAYLIASQRADHDGLFPQSLTLTSYANIMRNRTETALTGIAALLDSRGNGNRSRRRIPYHAA